MFMGWKQKPEQKYNLNYILIYFPIYNQQKRKNIFFRNKWHKDQQYLEDHK